MPRGHLTGQSDVGTFLVREKNVREEHRSEVLAVSGILTIFEVANYDAE
jgi:hypothetical protein